MDPITAALNALAAGFMAYTKTLDLMLSHYESMPADVRAERERADWEIAKGWMRFFHKLDPAFPAPPDTPAPPA